MNNLEELEKNIGYTFKNKDLLKKALTHKSYAYENKIESNEKLEFLGDSILEYISSKYIYNNYPKLKTSTSGELITKVYDTQYSSNYKIRDISINDISNVTDVELFVQSSKDDYSADV